MRITRSYDFYRRDFTADMECEQCGHEEKKVSCYDDSYFHNNVIPSMKCKSCGETSLSKDTGQLQTRTIPRYDDSVVM
jgi:C4-type Zn-finger protein